MSVAAGQEEKFDHHSDKDYTEEVVRVRVRKLSLGITWTG